MPRTGFPASSPHTTSFGAVSRTRVRLPAPHLPFGARVSGLLFGGRLRLSHSSSTFLPRRWGSSSRSTATFIILHGSRRMQLVRENSCGRGTLCCGLGLRWWSGILRERWKWCSQQLKRCFEFAPWYEAVPSFRCYRRTSFAAELSLRVLIVDVTSYH